MFFYYAYERQYFTHYWWPYTDLSNGCFEAFFFFSATVTPIKTLYINNDRAILYYFVIFP